MLDAITNYLHSSTTPGEAGSMFWATIYILLITIGVIFLLGRFTPYGFERLWPVILLVTGGVLLAQSSASSSGHMGN